MNVKLYKLAVVSHVILNLLASRVVFSDFIMENFRVKIRDLKILNNLVVPSVM